MKWRKRLSFDWELWRSKHLWWVEFDFLSCGAGWSLTMHPPDGYHTYHTTDIELWLLFLKCGYSFSEPGEVRP